MDPMALILLLYFAGVMLVVLELFVPSHGAITVAAVICLGAAVYMTFARSVTWGFVGTIGSLLVVPGIFMVGLRYIHKLPLGNQAAPPNPDLADMVPAEMRAMLTGLVGSHGLAITPLRPTGVCEFEGRRIQCVAESGWIDGQRAVEAIGVQMKSLVVRAVPPVA
jgi:membrane-bound ClpP family serine protease